MGIIQCPLHGLQHIHLVCEHVWNNFNEGIFPEFKEFPIIGTKICIDCFTKNNVSTFENIIFEEFLKTSKQEEEKIFKVFENIEQLPICVKCFNELKQIKEQ